jgi:MFS family permease
MTLGAPGDFTLFAAAAMTMSIAAIPLALTRQKQPVPVAFVRFRPMVLFRASPVGLVGVAASGLAAGAFWSLAAVAATGYGLSVHQAAIFMAIVTATGALAQWPAGRLSDRMDRRLVLVGVLAAAVLFGLMLALLPLSPGAWLVVGALFGASIAPHYSLAAAHAYDHALPGTTVETAAGLFIANASCAIIGPLIAATAMQHINPAALFLYTAAVHSALAAYVVTRIRARAPVADALKTEFDLAGTAQMPGGGAPMPTQDDGAVIDLEPHDDDPDAPPRGVAG